MEDDLQKKMEDGLKKNENERQPPFFCWKLEWRPQKKEDDLKQKWKTTSKKMEDNLKKI